MVDKGIPPPDFNSENAFNPIDNQFMEEETNAFRNLMESENKDQQRIQEEARKQVDDQEDALKQMVQKEETKQASQFEDREKGVEEEDAKKTTEEEDLKASEERRQAALKKGAQNQAQRFERETHLVENTENAGATEDQEGLETEDPLLAAKQLKAADQKNLSKETNLQSNKDSAAELDHSLRHEQKKIGSKARLEQAQREGQAAEKTSKKGETKQTTPAEKKQKNQNIQSIAANIALENQPLQAITPQKGQLDTSASKIDQRKELEQLAKQLIDEAEVLKKGDEIRTTITVDLPDSIFNKGKITVSTFKYRPLEVNLKFENFSGEGTKAIRQNQGELKNVLKINSLNVHQLDVIE